MTDETRADEAALKTHMTAPTVTALGPVIQPLREGDIEQDFLSVIVSI